MAIIQITLSFDGMNISAQVGDIAYYSYQVNNVGGFDHSKLSTTRKLGEIVGVNVGGGVNIVVEYDDAITFQVPNGSFISFAKEKKVNTSSLLGYYADIKFVNNSEKKAELFSVSSEIAESSK